MGSSKLLLDSIHQKYCYNFDPRTWGRAKRRLGNCRGTRGSGIVYGSTTCLLPAHANMQSWLPKSTCADGSGVGHDDDDESRRRERTSLKTFPSQLLLSVHLGRRTWGRLLRRFGPPGDPSEAVLPPFTSSFSFALAVAPGPRLNTW